VFVPPRREEHGRGIAKRQQPLTIPFDGVYWFFKFPDSKPPKDSYTAHGTAAEISYRSSDLVALQMEAHQNFVEPVDMDCCRRIGVEILNAEHTSERIWVELIVSNSRLQAGPSQSLGRQPISSTLPEERPGPAPATATEVLNFTIPQDSKIAQFDAATVRFIRNGRLGWSSVKIAVQGFTFVPREL
jgi:hypothetical protein